MSSDALNFASTVEQFFGWHSCRLSVNSVAPRSWTQVAPLQRSRGLVGDF